MRHDHAHSARQRTAHEQRVAVSVAACAGYRFFFTTVHHQRHLRFGQGVIKAVAARISGVDVHGAGQPLHGARLALHGQAQAL